MTPITTPTTEPLFTDAIRVRKIKGTRRIVRPETVLTGALTEALQEAAKYMTVKVKMGNGIYTVKPSKAPENWPCRKTPKERTNMTVVLAARKRRAN